MNPEDVGKILDEIGERIGPAGAYAWELTVRQVMIESAAWSVAAGVLVLVAIGGLVLSMRADPTTQTETASFGALACVLSFIAALVILPLNIVPLLNPEYHAMVRLLERLVP